jgi:hypothetical protein
MSGLEANAFAQNVPEGTTFASSPKFRNRLTPSPWF